MKTVLSFSGGARARRHEIGTRDISAIGSPAGASHGALQQFLERRRQRFVATFEEKCEAIRTLVDKVATLGPRGPIAKLRQICRRLSELAAIVGFSTISTRASELGGLVEGAGSGDFNAALARDAVEALREAIDQDLAVPEGGVVTDVPEDPVPFQPPAVTIERRGRQRVLSTVRVLIVDDHEILRHGLRALLSTEFSAAAFGEAADARHAVEQLRAKEWDVALIDISLPGKSGLDCSRK